MEDDALLAAWRSGDRARGNELFQRHIKSVSRFFRTKVPDAAEDLTQQTFLALLDPGHAPVASFRAYLFGIARNQMLMHLRGKSRAAARFDPLTWSAPAAGASPVKAASANEQARALAVALQQLPVDYQVALELHYFEGLAVAEIAEVVGKPAGTIKSLLSRGRDMLRERIAALVDDTALESSMHVLARDA